MKVKDKFLTPYGGRFEVLAEFQRKGRTYLVYRLHSDAHNPSGWHIEEKKHLEKEAARMNWQELPKAGGR